MIKINFESDVPIYVQLKDEIVKEIAKGNLKDGDSLPPIRQLSVDLEVNLHTVNKAYNILKEEGYLKIDRRKGAVISLSRNDIEQFDKKFNEELEILIAKAICKGYTKEELIKKINNSFNYFKKYNEID